MKRNDFVALKTKKIDELYKTAGTKRKDLFEILTRKGVKGGEKNVKKIKNLRKEIAQILTLIREKEILEKEGKKE